ncbi:MAG: 50S ribosomal protein L32 [Candidatus Paceibacterota bacterium]|jgi:large subunit ribosomal protein L32
MAVPKQRHNQSRRDRRRGNIFIKAPALVKCAKCGKPVLPHTICGYCGYYKGTEFVNVMAKLEKKEQKKRQKEIAETKTETKTETKKETKKKEKK